MRELTCEPRNSFGVSDSVEGAARRVTQIAPCAFVRRLLAVGFRWLAGEKRRALPSSLAPVLMYRVKISLAYPSCSALGVTELPSAVVGNCRSVRWSVPRFHAIFEGPRSANCGR